MRGGASPKQETVAIVFTKLWWEINTNDVLIGKMAELQVTIELKLIGH